VEQVKSDWREMELTKAEYAMLEYAEKLTLTPSAISEADVQKLRDAGWTDRDILDIVRVCAKTSPRLIGLFRRGGAIQ